MEQLVTITRKGQITIPVEIRHALGIKEGDKLLVSLAEGQDGAIIIRPVRSAVEMTYGLGAALSPVGADEAAKSARELREAFEADAAAAVMASLI